MKVLYLDCFSGISGDMTVGALCDLGVKPSTLEWELAKVEIGDFHMHFERKQRLNIEGVAFSIHAGATHVEEDEHCHDCGHDHGHGEHHHSHDHDHDHEHEHHHGHGEGHTHAHAHTHSHEHSHGEVTHTHEHTHSHAHGHGEHGHEHAASEAEKEASLPPHDHEHGDEVEHDHHHHLEGDEHEHAHTHGAHSHHHHHGGHVHGRSHQQIRELIEKSELSEFVKEHALSIFHRIAVAEGKIHGMKPADVTFHEVGALDSIADIICVCVGIEALGVQKVFASKLHDGTGHVDCAHGRFPLPAPATLEILTGIPIGQIDEPHELITPTGAAILAEFSTHFGLMPSLTVRKIGYGVGERNLQARPNVLRAVLGEMDDVA